MRNLCLYMNGSRGAAVGEAITDAGHVIRRVVVPSEDKKPVGERFAETWVCPDVNDPAFARAMAADQIGLGIVAGWPQIFRHSSFHPDLINLHAGPVPEYRGGSPLNWQIINGEPEIGVSVLRLTEGIDAGPVLAQRTFPLDYGDDIASVHEKANAAFAEALCDLLPKMAGCDAPFWGEPEFLPGEPQGEGVYWHQRSDADSDIDWNQPAERVRDFVRALTRPYPGARHGDKRIWEVRVPGRVIKGRPGHEAVIEGRRYVCCSDRAVEIVEASTCSPT